MSKFFLFFLFFILIIFCLSSCGLFAPNVLKTNQLSLKNAPFDAIIVPGVPHNGKGWDTIMMARVYWSKHLFDLGYTKNIIYSGSAVYTPFVEAKIMALYGEALEIPAENIFIENRAEHSTENVVYSLQLARKKGFKNIALATDPLQINILRRFIKKIDLPVALLPITLSTFRAVPKPEPSINFELAKMENFTPLPDRQSRLERLKGTFGRYILWEKEDLKKQRFVKKIRKQNRLIE